MTDNSPIAVPLSDPDANPMAILTQYNPTQNCHDLIVMVGNFKTDRKAREAADHIAQLLSEALGFSVHRAQ